MSRKTFAAALTAALVVALGGCELGVDNLNNPDRSRALATGDDVESLIGGSYASYWTPAHWDHPAMALEVAAEHMSASWGNFGMEDIGLQPAIPIENTTSYSRRAMLENGWEGWYAGISAGSDGLRAIDSGVEIGPGGERNPRARAFAKFTQGLNGCMIAALYDQAFLVDETTDFGGELSFAPYQDVMAFYVGKMQEAAQIASSNSFTLPSTNWLGKLPLTNTEFTQVIRSYMARCKAAVARSPSERAGLDWPGIVADVDAGTDGIVIQGETAGTSPWWSSLMGRFPEPNTWGRAHVDWVGQADTEGNYQAWLQIPPSQRTTPARVITPDLRFPQSQEAGSRGLYFDVQSSCCPFPPERGVYRQSWYSDFRFRDYQESCNFCWFGPMVEMNQQEMDLIKAEGLIRTGDVPGGTALINKTRVGNGGLTAVTGTGTVPTEPGGGCVPTKRFDPTGTCGDLMDALQYEYYTEISLLYAGSAFFFTRGHGELFPGRPLHFPVPAKDLETLQLDLYTFGGNPGAPGNAPPLPTVENMGDPAFALQRVQYALDAVEAYRERRQEELMTGEARRVH